MIVVKDISNSTYRNHKDVRYIVSRVYNIKSAWYRAPFSWYQERGYDKYTVVIYNSSNSVFGITLRVLLQDTTGI